MARDIDIVVVDDLVADVAERLAVVARRGGQVALTGGTSVRDAYERAAELEPDWAGVEIWWSDERCVPPTDERSNYWLAKGSLLDRVRRGAVHRIHGELGRDEGAELYEEELGRLERFDFVVLGLGADAHIASLFPDEPALDETELGQCHNGLKDLGRVSSTRSSSPPRCRF